MVQVDEYLLAGLALIGAFISFNVQIYDWKGVTSHPAGTKFLKWMAFILVVVICGFVGAVVHKKKGTKAASNLWAEESLPSVPPTSQVGGTPTPTITPTPVASPSPSTSPFPPPAARNTRSTRGKGAPRKIAPCSAEDRLLGKC